MSDEEEVVQGVFLGRVMKVDEPTKNGRIYPRSVMEREVARLKAEMEKGRVLGWPSGKNGSTTDRIADVSHRVTDMKVEDDGSVSAQVEVLATPNGEVLRRLIAPGGDDIGIRFGIRGYGTVDENGVVGDDFRLKTIDVNLDE